MDIAISLIYLKVYLGLTPSEQTKIMSLYPCGVTNLPEPRGTRLFRQNDHITDRNVVFDRRCRLIHILGTAVLLDDLVTWIP